MSLHRLMHTNQGYHTHAYPLLATIVGGEVVHWHFDAFALFQFSQHSYQQLKIKGIRMIKVVLVSGRQLLLLFTQNLQVGKKRKLKI